MAEVSGDRPVLTFRGGGKWGQTSIELPGSLSTNEMPNILRWYPYFLGFFRRLKNDSPNRDDGTFNRGNTDVLGKVTFFGGCFTTSRSLRLRKDQ